MMLLWKWWKFTKFHKIKLRILNWLYLSIVCIALRYCTARMVILLGFQSSMLTISAFNKSVRLYKVRSAAGKVDSALYSATKNLINILFKDIGNFSVFWIFHISLIVCNLFWEIFAMSNKSQNEGEIWRKFQALLSQIFYKTLHKMHHVMHFYYFALDWSLKGMQYDEVHVPFFKLSPPTHVKYFLNWSLDRLYS